MRVILPQAAAGLDVVRRGIPHGAPGVAYGARMFDDVIVVSRQLRTTTGEEVRALESDLAPMPPGYAEFVTALGEGTFGDSLQVKLPATVRRDLPEARERWSDYWFWDERLLTREQAAGAVLVADTDTGDEVVVHPAHRGRLLVLPRDSEEVVDAGSTLGELLDWYCTSGLLTPPTDVRWFMSWAGRTTYQSWHAGDGPRMRAAALALGLHAAVQEYDDGAVTLVLPHVGGRLSITPDGDASVRYDTGLGSRFEPIARALAEAGAQAGAPWGDVD